MIYFESNLDFRANPHISLLRECYDNIFNEIMINKGFISHDKYNFNNHIGDITKDIRWTWAINSASKKLFENCIISLKDKINSHFRNEFEIFGASFITLYDKKVENSEYHIDVNSFYDNEDTNILTLIFPLYIEEYMGGLEFIVKKHHKVYKYDTKKVFIWDACKLFHRTQPYELSKKEKRVLVSINLVSKEQWAIDSISNTLKYQGNM